MLQSPPSPKLPNRPPMTWRLELRRRARTHNRALTPSFMPALIGGIGAVDSHVAKRRSRRNTRDMFGRGAKLPSDEPRPRKQYDKYVSEVFEGGPETAPEPQRGLRDAMGRPFRIISSPQILNGRQRTGELVKFLTRIRRAVLLREKRVFVDLSTCLSIDTTACILLAAELHRCQSLAREYVYGCDPAAVDALKILRDLGFHELLKINNHAPAPASPWVARIRAGHGTEDGKVAPILDEVAQLALTAWGDPAFHSQILAALNEAMTNVLMHAYPETISARDDCVPGAWWAAGIVNPETNEAWFFAFDQGVGLPATVPARYENFFTRHGLDPNEPVDHLIMAAAISESHTQTGKEQHGQGLPAMIRLIDDKAVGGSIAIASLQGEHMIVKNPTKVEPQLRRVEFGRKLNGRIPGTLIIWKLDGPMVGPTAEGGE